MSANEIKLILDKPNYLAGDWVKGKVYLNICMPVEIATLTLTGEEHIRFSSIPEDESTIIPTIKELHKSIVDFKMSMKKSSGTKKGLGFGKYTFPFKVKIPSDAPSTFVFQRGNTIGKVSYEILIKLGEEEIKKDLVVVEKKSQEPLNVREMYRGKEVTRYCCFPGGKVLISAFFTKDNYSNKEPIRFIAGVDCTKSSVGVKSLKVKFELQVTLTLEGDCTTKKILIGNYRSESVKKGEKKEGIELEFDMKETSKLMPSYLSRRIKAKYILSLVAEMNSTRCFCCNENPEFFRAVNVFNPVFDLNSVNPERPKIKAHGGFRSQNNRNLSGNIAKVYPVQRQVMINPNIPIF